MVEIEYIIELEPEWKAMAFLLRGEDYQKKLLYDVRKDLNQELKELLPDNYSFLRKDVPVSSVQEQNLKLAEIRIESEDKVYKIHIKETMKKQDAMFATRAAAISTSKPRCFEVKPSPLVEEKRAKDRLRGIQFSLERKETKMASLQDELVALNGELASLREKPRERVQLGNNLASTCTNCHAKGHRNSQCNVERCKSYFSCGMLSHHKEHKLAIKVKEDEIKEARRQLKTLEDEAESDRFLQERSKTYFFSAMRVRLRAADRVLYSDARLLDKDLKLLAAAVKHEIPKEGTDLIELVETQKRRSNAFRRHSGVRSESPIRTLYQSKLDDSPLRRSPRLAKRRKALLENEKIDRQRDQGRRFRQDLDKYIQDHEETQTDGNESEFLGGFFTSTPMEGTCTLSRRPDTNDHSMDKTVNDETHFSN